MPSNIGNINLTRWQVAKTVYDASRSRGWGPVRSARWGYGAWRRHPNGMRVVAKAIK
jgi:hypothetical protein